MAPSIRNLVTLATGEFRRGTGEFSDFEDYAHHMSDVLARACCLVGIVGTLALWPVDFLILHDYPAEFANFVLGRSINLALLVIGFTGIVWWGWRGHRTARLWLALFLLTIGITYVVAARIGDPTGPWIHTSLLAPILTVVLLVPFRPRVLVTICAGMVPIIAYFGSRPDYLGVPFVGTFFASMSAACAIAVTLGHILYTFVRIAFDEAKALEQAIRTDALTGLLSRGYVMERTRGEVARARRSKSELSFLLVDIDHFKHVNDTWGHAVGDEVLNGVARAMCATLRGTDLIGRIGGEEFLIVLPDTDLAAGREAAERVRTAVASSAPEDRPPVTVSIGVTARLPTDTEPATILKRADVALYQAKDQGRDLVVTN